MITGAHSFSLQQRKSHRMTQTAAWANDLGMLDFLHCTFIFLILFFSFPSDFVFIFFPTEQFWLCIHKS